MPSIGVSPPPPGVTPDFDGVSSLQTSLMCGCVATFSLATIFLLLRWYTKLRLLQSVYWDDALLLLAWTVALVYLIFLFQGIKAGMGKHLYEVTPEGLSDYAEAVTVFGIAYVVAPALTKLSLLLTYFKIQSDLYFRCLLSFVSLSILGYTVTTCVMITNGCEVHATRDPVCMGHVALAQGLCNIITDVILIVLPIPIVHKLNMSIRKKLVVGSIFALGSVIIVCSIARLKSVMEMQNNPDVTWTYATAAIWSNLEVNLGIACNSLVSLRPLLRKVLESCSESFQQSKKTSARHDGHVRMRSDEGRPVPQSHELRALDDRSNSTDDILVKRSTDPKVG